MNIKLLVIGILLGICAAALTGYYVHTEIAAYQVGTGPDWVLETTADIKEGGYASQSNLKAVQLPEGMDSAVLGCIPATQLLVIEGRQLQKRVEAHKILLWSHLVSAEMLHPDPLPTKIPKDWRAITIPVSQISGAGGWIRPGDFIDLLGSFSALTSGPGGTQAAAVTVLQRQRVLATGIETTNDPSQPGGPHPYGNITLLVTAQDAEKLVFAMRQGGALTAVLRGAQDEDTHTVEPVSWTSFASSVGLKSTTSP